MPRQMARDARRAGAMSDWTSVSFCMWVVMRPVAFCVPCTCMLNVKCLLCIVLCCVELYCVVSTAEDDEVNE